MINFYHLSKVQVYRKINYSFINFVRHTTGKCSKKTQKWSQVSSKQNYHDFLKTCNFHEMVKGTKLSSNTKVEIFDELLNHKKNWNIPRKSLLIFHVNKTSIQWTPVMKFITANFSVFHNFLGKNFWSKDIWVKVKHDFWKHIIKHDL